MEIDDKFRLECAKHHSGGHLLSTVMTCCGYKNRVTKGHHFIDGAYVEYEGDLTVEKEKLLKELNEMCVNLIQ